MDEITAGLQRGDRQAWSALYEAYADRIWRQVWRLMGGPTADVADVVQEVFMAAAKSARQFDPGRGSVWLWLMGIARRRVALRFRQQASRLAVAKRWWAGLDGEGQQWLSGSADAPAAVLESKELATLVRATLLELTADYQTLLISRYVDGVTSVQIALRTGSSDVAIRAKLMRARQAFRKALRKVAGSDWPQFERAWELQT